MAKELDSIVHELYEVAHEERPKYLKVPEN
jgi:hypothetical protein